MGAIVITIDVGDKEVDLRETHELVQAIADAGYEKVHIKVVDKSPDEGETDDAF